MKQNPEPHTTMSETKEWKIGDYCYIFPATSQEVEFPSIFKRLPFKITDILEGEPRIFTARTLPINDTVTECTRNIREGGYMEECPEEVFVNFAKSILNSYGQEVQKLETTLHSAKQSELKTQALLQELHVKF